MTQDYYDYSSDEEVIEFRRRNDEARRARQLARQRIFEEPAEIDGNPVRKMARDVRTRVFDDYDEAVKKSKQQDRKTLEYIDAILKNPSASYGPLRKATEPLPEHPRRHRHRRGSHSDHYFIIETNSTDTEEEHRQPPVEPKQPTVRPSETARQRVRRIEARLDGILDYELPSAESFKNMRHSLREINDKMAKQRLLLDRRTHYEEEEDTRNVNERIDQKYRELEERMPCLSVSERSRTRHGTGFDPALIPGYVTGLSVTSSEQTAELRGRIRTLLCRTRRTTGSDEAHTTSARRRREITVK